MRQIRPVIVSKVQNGYTANTQVEYGQYVFLNSGDLWKWLREYLEGSSSGRGTSDANVAPETSAQ